MNNLNVNWSKVRKVVVWLTIIVLGYATIQYEKVNFTTTYESLGSLFGYGNWVRILAEAVIITDLAALARIFTSESGKDEPAIVKVLFGIWVLVTALDAGLTYFFAAVEMERTIVVAPVAVRPFLNVFPVLIALLVWGIQGGLLYLFGRLLESAIHENKEGTKKTSNKVNVATTSKPLTGAAAAVARWNTGGKKSSQAVNKGNYSTTKYADTDIEVSREMMY